ncbi:MAG: hypothetical protein LUH22_03420 [Bacteroides sp.]|nr:hypothetical protein [Bacteroides sp.]
MKKVLFIITLLCCIASCTTKTPNGTQNPEGFQITVDTITVHIKDLVNPATRVELTQAVKFNNKYYCIFTAFELYYFINNNRYFLIINSNGNIERNIPLPEEVVKGFNFELFVNKDTIFLLNELSKKMFYLEQKQWKWTPAIHTDEIIFEDNHYYILNPHRNKMGCTTWFRDKQTEVEYEFNSHGRIINKIDSTYYITSDIRVLEIDNPAKLMPCHPERYHPHILKSEKYIRGSESLEGVKVLFGDSICNHLDCEATQPEYQIFTSFTANKKLYHLCSSDSNLFIAKIDSGRLIPVQHLDVFDKTLNFYNSDLMTIWKDNSQLLKFKTIDPNQSGMIEIKENKLNIRYLNHISDTIEYLRKETFPLIFRFIVNHIDSLHIAVADSLERKNGSTYLQSQTQRPTYHSYYPHSKNFEFEGAKVYLKSEDEIITNVTHYDCAKKDSLVKSIFLKWLETKTFIDKYKRYPSSKKNIPKKAYFQNKLDEIVQTVSHTLNVKPKKMKPKRGKIKLEWKDNNGLKVELYCENLDKEREIRMIIYKD